VNARYSIGHFSPQLLDQVIVLTSIPLTEYPNYLITESPKKQGVTLGGYFLLFVSFILGL